MSTPLPWTVLQTMFDPFFPKGQQLYYFKSTYLDIFNDKTFDTIIKKASNPPQPMILIALWHLGGAMSRVDDEETAFKGRKSPLLLSVDASWDDPQANNEVINYARGLLNDLKPFSPGGLYVNFAGLGEEGEDLVKAAYGENYKRLAKLKAKYDPENLFHLNQNIKPKRG